MKIGFIGLGKLGLPVAYTIAQKGHEVLGYDVKEIQLSELLNCRYFELAESIQEVVDFAEIVFVAVQTPHAEEHEGIHPITSVSDFDYSFLLNVLKEINERAKKEIVLAIISTVSPGTYATKICPLITNPAIEYVYNPFFIAMGTVVEDFKNPEFVLLGSYERCFKLESFYSEIHDRPIVRMGITSAEITKMAYNTFIGLKIVFANNLMEMAEIFGGDVDEITGALKMATDRIVSTRYMDAGMGDGGGCHPRDNIVLSHIAKTKGMSIDLAGYMMQAREAQAEWLCDICLDYEMPIFVLGLEFKPESKIKTGSAAVLCLNILKNCPNYREAKEGDVAVYLIGCKHKKFIKYKFPVGSVVIDPHRYIPNQEGVKIIRLG